MNNLKLAEKKRDVWVVWYADKNLEGRKDRVVWAGSLESARKVVREVIKDMPAGWHVRVLHEVEAYVSDVVASEVSEEKEINRVKLLG